MTKPCHKKTFVLDTNVILHDSSCIHQFDEHDIVLPITVIEELDGFKKGKEIINCNARGFLRSLDALTEDKLFNGGVPLGENKGKISIFLTRQFHDRMNNAFSMSKADHHILNAACHMTDVRPDSLVTLVTKDVNLRMKAKSIGIMAEDYTTDYVKDLEGIYRGKRVVENVPGPVIESLYRIPFETDIDKEFIPSTMISNEYLILRNGGKSALGVFDPQ